MPQRKRDTSANPFSAELWSVLLNPPLIRVRVQCSASRQWRKESVWDEWLHNKYRGYSGGLVQHQQRWRFRPVVQTWRCLLRGLRLPATSRHQHPGLPSQQDYRSPPGNRLVRAEVMVEKGNAHGAYWRVSSWGNGCRIDFSWKLGSCAVGYFSSSSSLFFYRIWGFIFLLR